MNRGKAAGQVLVWILVLVASSTSTAAHSASLPSGRQLLNQMAAAARHANSFHFHYILDEIRSDGSREVSRREGDVALRQKMLRLRIAVEALSPGQKRTKRRFTQTQEVIVAGAHGAERHPGDNWLCVAGYADQTPPMLVSLHADRISAIRNLGATTADHIPVWHVTVSALRHANAQTLHILVHEYIARTGNRPVREALDVRYRQAGGPVVEDRYTVDYSRFGERVRLRVPACRQP